MKVACVVSLLITLCIAGCSTPGSQYAGAHPELSAAHREILRTGKMPGGSAVEGMTKEQVQLAMGAPLRTNGGGDVWVYVHERFVDISPVDDVGSTFGSGANDQRNFTEKTRLGPRPTINEVTTIFFENGRATLAQLSRERP